jgi:hypothetical protein
MESSIVVVEMEARGIKKMKFTEMEARRDRI